MLKEERPCNIFGQFIHSCCLVYIKGRLSLLFIPAKPVDWDCWSLTQGDRLYKRRRTKYDGLRIRF